MKPTSFLYLFINLLHEEWMKASLRLLDGLSIWFDIKPVDGQGLALASQRNSRQVQVFLNELDCSASSDDRLAEDWARAAFQLYFITGGRKLNTEFAMRR